MKSGACWLTVLVSLSFAVCGCGGAPAGPKMYTVSGEVKFDEKPVETGRILFRLKEGDQSAFAGDIKDGKYSLKTEKGKMTVEITASRLIPGKFSNVNGKPEPVGEMYLPQIYNSKTTLEATVEEGKSNHFPFDLKSK